MEVPGGNDRKFTVALLELMGTSLFVFGILVSGGNALGVPLSLFACILIFGGITGGHFNPAVSFGVFIVTENRSQNICFLIMIIIAQCIGAFVAVGMSFLALYLKADGKLLI